MAGAWLKDLLPSRTAVSSWASMIFWIDPNGVGLDRLALIQAYGIPTTMNGEPVIPTHHLPGGADTYLDTLVIEGGKYAI